MSQNSSHPTAPRTTHGDGAPRHTHTHTHRSGEAAAGHHPAGPGRQADTGAPAGPGWQADQSDQAEFLDLEAEVLAEHISAITAWLPVEAPPRHIVDLGCGTGAGTFALLDRFPEARVTAVDSSAEHLRRLREKACALGTDDRVRAVPADLDAPAWPDLGAPELVWASASLHHMAEPDRTLRQVRELLPPGGLFTLVEPAGSPRVLPGDAPEDRPGLEERCHAALAQHHAARMPHRGADWGPKLTAAGFTVEGERTVAVHVDSARNPAVGRYALSGLRRLRSAAAHALPAADLAALDRLLDTAGPDSVVHRDDLAVRTERTVWAARRA
ncbi:class I SAM-dependent methyltransferase [Streptomyces zingiberis]|uniref:Methyltransferase domain-containing protein n=1 Tax=Streptomyces zingiberis TaxID=2053010 RepID=A0ABX1C4M6_9ACTN|nr:class I SAM-dependent methyltransferase [Streptomyces zingiberis]NJQ02872.1 methyltransferase domain-containing protein [Streptomyces zingiberis]